jgi:hypothetical protein
MKRGAKATTGGLVALAIGSLLAGPSTPLRAQSKAKGWTAPRVDGHPDLQGVWVSGTSTPFERPSALGTKGVYSEEEARIVERDAAARRAAASAPRAGDVGNDNEAFVDSGYTLYPTRQTSQIVDPPDGRLPLLAAVDAKRDFNLSSRDAYESMSPWDRCITRGPTLMLPTGYNNGVRIVQTPRAVVIESEMIHEARIVPLDRAVHLPATVRSWTGDPTVRSWTGDPIGRWEGDTLVVDSTNFNDRGWVATHAATGRLRGVPNSTALHIVERFTRSGPGTIAYSMTVEDAAAFARPWTVALTLSHADDYQLFEFACHEGNQAVELVLRGARFEERSAVR